MNLFVASAIARSFCSNYRVQFFTTEGTEDTEGVRRREQWGGRSPVSLSCQLN